MLSGVSGLRGLQGLRDSHGLVGLTVTGLILGFLHVDVGLIIGLSLVSSVSSLKKTYSL